MDTIYIIAITPEDKYPYRSRFVLGDAKPPLLNEGERISVTITSPAAKEMVSEFLTAMGDEVLSEVYKVENDIYCASCGGIAHIMISGFLHRINDDYIKKEITVQDDGSILEQVTTRVTTLRSLT